MVVDRPNAIVSGGLSRCRDHYLLSLGTPQRPQGRKPTHIEFVRIIKDGSRFQVIAGLLNRLFFTRYSGSGLLILCWGRLSTISACFRWTRTVSAATRIPVCSAR